MTQQPYVAYVMPLFATVCSARCPQVRELVTMLSDLQHGRCNARFTPRQLRPLAQQPRTATPVARRYKSLLILEFARS